MAITADSLSRWAARIVGILVSLFIGVFAFDAFGEGKPVLEALPEFLIHVIPAVVLLAIVGASSRWPWLGALTFTGLAAVYTLTMANGRLDWMLAISGPLLVVGALFLWSWLRHAA
jgi:hypothetical protein